MKDYRYHCLFNLININTKRIDNYAFFVFFTLKGWKRLLLAEAPRQVINLVTLEVLAPKWLKIHNGLITFDNDALGDDVIQQVLTGTMAFSVLVFAISFLLVCAATILYIPLFCHIRGNLKEYCCHKVDKRISEILRKQGQRGKSRKENHDAEQLINESYYKRPLALDNGFFSPNPSYEKLSDLSPSVSDDRLSQHLLAKNDQSYFMDDHKLSGNYMESNSRSPSNQHYYPKPSAQQLPYQNRAYQYYSSSQHNIGSPATPSSTCANEKRYQYRMYPQGG